MLAGFCRVALIASGLSLSFGAALAEDLDASQTTAGACSAPSEEQQQRGCICMLPIASPPPTGIVLLTKIQGKVLKSGDGGYSPVSEPTWLNVGDTVLVKSSSTAVIEGGANCRRQIGPNASLIIKEVDQGCACAALVAEKHVAALHPLLFVGAAAAAAVAVGAAMPYSP